MPRRKRQPIPICAASMGCLCAGHARGNPADAACDTREMPAAKVGRAAPNEGFSASLSQALAVLGIDSLDELETVLDSDTFDRGDLTPRGMRALGWLQGAAEALDMTVIELVDANT